MKNVISNIFKKTRIISSFVLLPCSMALSQSQGGEWTWIDGDNAAGVAVYGTQGTASTSNKPPGLMRGLCWTDSNGKFWLYGGMVISPNVSSQADLWMFDPTTLAWTWVKGPGAITTPISPNYGTQGVSSPSNHPGSRAFGATWADSVGNLWLFGGGAFMNGTNYADLWKYNIATNEWTWMKGPNGTFFFGGTPSGNYGTQGVSSPSNNPACREYGNCTWVDNSGNLWLFGGKQFSGTACTSPMGTPGPQTDLNDLWKYNVSTNEWTWMHGANTPGDWGTHGTLGVANSNNRPSARATSWRWKDNSGNLWLWAGHGLCNDEIGGVSTCSSNMHDMWKYDISTNMWTWMNGSQHWGELGSPLGSSCSPSVSNLPSTGMDFDQGVCMTDKCGNFWFYGNTYGQFLPDANVLWRYNPNTNEWAWSGNPSGAGNYGSQGVSTPTNNPPSRFDAMGWFDQSGNIWMGLGVENNVGDLKNDIWKFSPDYCVCVACNVIDVNVTASDSTICGGSTTLTATGANNYTWSPATGLSSTTGASVSASPTVTTTYTVIGTIGNCLADTTTITITVNGQQSADFSYDGPFCQSDVNPLPILDPGSSAGTFTSTPNGLVFESEVSGEVDLSASAPGTYTITNTLPASGQCQATTATATITINATQDATFSYTDTSYCQSAGISTPSVTGVLGGVFTASPAGLFIDSQTGAIDLSSPANTYTITYTTPGPCANTFSQIIQITNSFSIVVDDVEICEGEVVLVSGVPSVPGGTYSWAPGGENSSEITVSPTVTSNYTVTYTLGGCMATDVGTVVVNSSPTASITAPTTTIASGETIQLQANGAGSYLWSNGATNQVISVSPTEATTYCLVVTENGCQDSTCITIEIGCESLIYAPNCITANDDMINEEFIVKGDCLYQYHLMIFNRWGELIFESFDITDSWDGTYKTKDVQDGVYTYLIDARGFDNKFYNLNGFVTVIR